MKVLFICRGNVGRSQIAEVIFNSLAGGKHVASSAGTKVGEHDGQRIGDRSSAMEVLLVLDEIGIDARDNTRTQLTEEMLETADIVISMAEVETLPDFIEKYPEVIHWDLVDPFEQSLEFTRTTREKITALVKDLLIKLG